jgi:hypothetical protein
MVIDQTIDTRPLPRWSDRQPVDTSFGTAAQRRIDEHFSAIAGTCGGGTWRVRSSVPQPEQASVIKIISWPAFEQSFNMVCLHLDRIA